MNESKNQFDALVIGSGPSGVSCAKAILQQGLSVGLIDVGIKLEPEKQKTVDRLFDLPFERWTAEDYAGLKKGFEVKFLRLPSKYVFGSNFAYRNPGIIESNEEDCHFDLSFARGGLSTAWGAAILPYRKEDVDDWPFPLSRLEPHYGKVADLMKVMGETDGLAGDFPLFVHQPNSLRLSAQAGVILARLSQNAGHLKGNGFSFGRSRLAFNKEPFAHHRGCVYCECCLYGCPLRLIYSSESTLAELETNTRFQYCPGLVATKFEEDAGGVTLHCQSPDGGPEITFRAGRLFVACGAISSAALLARSLGLWDEVFTIRDSAYFLLPALIQAPVLGFVRGNSVALAQLFLELMAPAICSRSIHMQVYTYNDLYEKILGLPGWWLRNLFRRLNDLLFSRFVLIQGFLHSDVSPGARLQFRCVNDRLACSITGETSDNASTVLRRLLSLLQKEKKATLLWPLGLALRRANIGRSFHSGSIFPMSNQPHGHESDLYGRAMGLLRVHLVDASVLPSVPGTTITFSVMANAHRIGTEAWQLSP